MTKLPEELIRGNNYSLNINGLMQKRDEKYEALFIPGQKTLGAFYIPYFQRQAVWNDEQSEKLIESLYYNIPIGSIIISCADNAYDYKKEQYPITADWIIDGQQRIKSIEKYLNNEIIIFRNTDYEHKYSDLNETQKRLFGQKCIPTIKIYSDDENKLKEIYNILNFSGTPHKEDEKAV